MLSPLDIPLPVQHWPRFFPVELADQWLELSLALPWQRQMITIMGRQMPVPRLECFFGDSESYEYLYSSSVHLKALRWPTFLAEMRSQVEAITGYRYPVVMGNQYRTGQDSNGYHADDEPTLGKQPAIASVSLGATRTFRLKPKKRGHSTAKQQSIPFELHHGDLILMQPGCQENWVHTIPKTKRKVGVRVNWTFRPYHDSPMDR